MNKKLNDHGRSSDEPPFSLQPIILRIISVIGTLAAIFCFFKFDSLGLAIFIYLGVLFIDFCSKEDSSQHRSGYGNYDDIGHDSSSDDGGGHGDGGDGGDGGD